MLPARSCRTQKTSPPPTTPDPRLLDLITRLAETAAALMLGSYEMPPVIEEALWKADDAQ